MKRGDGSDQLFSNCEPKRYSPLEPWESTRVTQEENVSSTCPFLGGGLAFEKSLASVHIFGFVDYIVVRDVARVPLGFTNVVGSRSQAFPDEVNYRNSVTLNRLRKLRKAWKMSVILAYDLVEKTSKPDHFVF